MKGKSKSKKVRNIVLLALSFILTIVLTASITLAWFYDEDWASSQLTMAGTVGIEMQDDQGVLTSGAGNLHFKLTGSDALAYPGQAIQVEAQVYNNGGDSVRDYFDDDALTDGMASAEQVEEAADAGKGSPCYVRAYFEVITNIDDPNLDSSVIFSALTKLVEERNADMAGDGMQWVYWKNPNSNAAVKLDGDYYYQGSKTYGGETITEATVLPDIGYYYLCTAKAANVAESVLKVLNVGDTAVFLWDGYYIIPWQLTNTSADKIIYVGLRFEAIQTFIPQMSDGSIVKTGEAGGLSNALTSGQCQIGKTEVQTIFNTCNFEPIKYKVNGEEKTAAQIMEDTSFEQTTGITEEPVEP